MAWTGGDGGGGGCGVRCLFFFFFLVGVGVWSFWVSWDLVSSGSESIGGGGEEEGVLGV